jgi:acyl-CoA dehydrogenase
MTAGARWTPSWTDEDLEAFRGLARTFCQNELVPHQERWARCRQVDRDLWKTAGDTGLLCLSVPVRYGGGGGSLAYEVVLAEEQARVGDTAWGITAHGMVAQYLLAHGTEQQKTRWLPGLASGELVGAIAITEPEAGSDIQNIATTAVSDGDEYVVDGGKTFITNGAQADLLIITVLIDGRISLLVVETGHVRGFQRGRVLDKIGRHGQDTAELFFGGMRVPAGNLLGGGAPGRGLSQLGPLMSMERLLIAVSAVAAMESALEETVRYVKERRAFGRKVMRYQNTRFTLADCATEVAVSRVFLDRCVERFLDGGLELADAAMVKMWTTDRLSGVVDECLQLFGGYGYLSEFPIARAWTDARATRIYGGTNEIMREIISGSL